MLTESDLPNYTIEDVVMTLPGHDVIYPEHEINKQAYEELMKKDGIEMKSWSHKQKYVIFVFKKYLQINREFASYGAYRKIIIKPKDIEA